MLNLFTFGALTVILQAPMVWGCNITVTGWTYEFNNAEDTVIQGIESAALCEEECMRNSECEGYTFQPDMPISFCLIFKTVADDPNLPCNGECLTGTVVRMRSGSACQDYPEEFIAGIEAENSEDCLNKCQDNAACRNFVFFDDNFFLPNTCFLYGSQCGNYSECSHCESGELHCIVTQADVPQQCNNHNILDDATRINAHGYERYVDNSDNNSFKSPDWKGAGWYGFKAPAGQFMPEKSPGSQHCGTYYSGYLTDPHPTNLFDTVQAQVCFDGTDHGYGDCFQPEQIEITKCGDDAFVYKLNEVSVSKLIRYCGTNEPPLL